MKTLRPNWAGVNPGPFDTPVRSTQETALEGLFPEHL